MIFVDSSAWIALLNEADGHHTIARRFSSELANGRYGRLVTTDYVLDEAATYLRFRAPSSTLKQFRSILEGSASLETIWTTPIRFWAAWDVLSNRDDMRWSLTDCLSFVTMETLGIRTAFSFDADFAQAGFRLLPTIR
jgi:predicted nucleic acid-binding protein